MLILDSSFARHLSIRNPSYSIFTFVISSPFVSSTRILRDHIYNSQRSEKAHYDSTYRAKDLLSYDIFFFFSFSMTNETSCPIVNSHSRRTQVCFPYLICEGEIPLWCLGRFVIDTSHLQFFLEIRLLLYCIVPISLIIFDNESNDSADRITIRES